MGVARTKVVLHDTDLGRMAYAQALAMQRQINQEVIEGRRPPTLLLVEHDPVITISNRRGAAKHLLASAEQLAWRGIDLQTTDRGGDITYHGPGQLVVYPILKLTPLGLNLGRYMRLLEEVAIATLAVFGINARPEQGATGVWVAMDQQPGAARPYRPLRPGLAKPGRSVAQARVETSPAKICAMGVRIRKNTTMHGLALNVNPDLSHFDLIVPCGLSGRGATSMARMLPRKDVPAMAQVKEVLINQMHLALQQAADASAGAAAL